MKGIQQSALLLFICPLILVSLHSAGQKGTASASISSVISLKETERIERFLSSDDMRGRKNFSPEIDKAADFISQEFKAAGLQTFGNSNGFRQEFAMIRTKQISVDGTFDGASIESKNIIFFTAQPDISFNEQSGFERAYVKQGDTLQVAARRLFRKQRNILVIVDPAFAGQFGNINRLKSSLFKFNHHVIFVLSSVDPVAWIVRGKQEISEMPMANVVGVLPGKSKKDEYVVFSGHYDHMGTGTPVNGDSIYNGANDDAAGITGVIMLAKYFSQLKNNERTIIFAAFTAEEMGGFGSQHFSRQLEADKVVAMFNIEMIGTESKWGKNSAYITGYEKTNMGELLAKDLKGTGFSFHPDPYPAAQLFYRSDNATLARLGVPAHTISTSKMDIEPHYHKVTDHIETLDLENMTKVIHAIAISAKSIIAGTATPTRVKVEDLR